jgi:hypothetical protein
LAPPPLRTSRSLATATPPTCSPVGIAARGIAQRRAWVAQPFIPAVHPRIPAMRPP